MFAKVGKDLVLRLWIGPLLVALNPGTLGAALGIALLLLVLALWFRRGIPQDPEARPSRRMAFLLAFLDLVENQVLGGMPAKLRRTLLPFMATLLLFILACNLSSILPIPGMVAPTQDLNVTLGLALLVYLFTHVYGIRSKGALRHLKGYLEPIPVMLPMNLVGDMGRTLSHGFRLFGNILGGAIMVAVAFPVLLQFIQAPFFSGLLGVSLAGVGLGLRRWKRSLGLMVFSVALVLLVLTGADLFLGGMGVETVRFGLGALLVGPAAGFILNAFFGIFAGTIQALVFTLLAAAYIQVSVE